MRQGLNEALAGQPLSVATSRALRLLHQLPLMDQSRRHPRSSPLPHRGGGRPVAQTAPRQLPGGALHASAGLAHRAGQPECQRQSILGEPVYPSLSEAAQHARIELVNCFRNSADIPPIVDEAIAIGAQAVWMQLGVEHAAAAAKARAAGLAVVQNRCLKIDHAARTRA